MAFYIFDLDGTLALNAHRNHHLQVRPYCETPQCAVVPVTFETDMTAESRIVLRCSNCHQPASFTKKDWDAFNDAAKDDAPHQPVIDILMMLSDQGHEIEIWSGRDERVREMTADWLIQQWVPARLLKKMRPHGDHTEDSAMKRSWLYERRALGLPDPVMVFDDRDRVVAMWREEGIVCCQVAPGNF